MRKGKNSRNSFIPNQITEYMREKKIVWPIFGWIWLPSGDKCVKVNPEQNQIEESSKQKKEKCHYLCSNDTIVRFTFMWTIFEFVNKTENFIERKVHTTFFFFFLFFLLVYSVLEICSMSMFDCNLFCYVLKLHFLISIQKCGF